MTSFEFFKEKKTVPITLNGLKIEIPSDWKTTKLGKVAKVGSGRKPPVQGEGEVPIYGKSLLGFTTKPMIKSGEVMCTLKNVPLMFISVVCVKHSPYIIMIILCKRCVVLGIASRYVNNN